MDYSYYVTPESYEIAEQNGISRKTLETRVRDLGWGTKRATTTQLQPRRDYGRWPEIAEKNGINRRTYIQRIKRGWDPERASTEQKKTKSEHGKLIGTQRRVYPKHYIELAETNGICYSTFKSRMAEGWTLEEASTEPKVSYSEAGKRGKGWRGLVMAKKCKHKWVIHQRSKRCELCGKKDKNFGIDKYNKERGITA